MKQVLFIILFLLASPAHAEILKTKIDGIIDPITAGFIQSSVEEAEESEAEFLLIELATPGGLGVSMQEIIQTILNSEVPIVVYVTPKGAHAASAGFFILLSADVAAMAPGTNTGAAHPVSAFGSENEVMMEKVRNDYLANLRSIVQRRNRNYEMAEQGVLESKSYTAQEALDGGLIDLLAENEQELLSKLNGMEITRFTGAKQTINTQGQALVELEMSLREKILSTIASPNLAVLLGLFGLLGLYIEFTNPGTILPGVAGGICLLLALLGFSLLPVNIIGLLLILLAIGLFVAEVLVQGFGVLGIGGVISMILGMLFLIDTPFPELRVSLGVALAIAIPFALIFMFLLRLAIRSFRFRVTTGEKGLEGLIGTARTDINQDGGTIFVHGELWRAVSKTPIPKGSKVRVVQAQNLQLRVSPYSGSDSSAMEEIEEKGNAYR